MTDNEDRFVSRARARVGTLLKGKWHLDAMLGYGGMAAVYAATHRNGHQAAVKLLHPHLAAEQRIRERFLREGYVANTVDHPGAVRVIDDDNDGESVYLVMELLDGETLDRRAARKGGRLPMGEVLKEASSLLETLEAAHKRGVFHRDIKPENIFLTRVGGVKILDFGIALLRELANEGVRTTRSGATTGTPAFMSPEQALGKSRDVDGRSDIYQVGATMFTLLTGRLVHESESVNEMLVMAATMPAPAISDILPELPNEVCDIVDCALQFNIADRFPDAAAMRVAIESALDALDLREPAHLETTDAMHLASVPPPPKRAHRKAFEKAIQQEAEADEIVVDPVRIPKAPPSPFSGMSPIPPVVIRGPNSLPSLEAPTERPPGLSSVPSRRSSRQFIATVALGVVAIVGGMGARAFFAIRASQSQQAAATLAAPISSQSATTEASASSSGSTSAPGSASAVAARDSDPTRAPRDDDPSGNNGLEILPAPSASTAALPGLTGRGSSPRKPPVPLGRNAGPLLEKRH